MCWNFPQKVNRSGAAVCRSEARAGTAHHRPRLPHRHASAPCTCVHVSMCACVSVWEVDAGEGGGCDWIFFSWVGNAIRDVITPTKHQTDNKLCISTTSNMRLDLETCFHYPADVTAKLSHGNHAGSLCFFGKDWGVKFVSWVDGLPLDVRYEVLTKSRTGLTNFNTIRIVLKFTVLP